MVDVCMSVVLSICAKLKSFHPSRDLRLRDRVFLRDAVQSNGIGRNWELETLRE